MSFDPLPDEDDELGTVLEVNCALASQDAFGKVSKGFIKFSGLVTTMKILRKDYPGRHMQIKIVEEDAQEPIYE